MISDGYLYLNTTPSSASMDRLTDHLPTDTRVAYWREMTRSHRFLQVTIVIAGLAAVYLSQDLWTGALFLGVMILHSIYEDYRILASGIRDAQDELLANRKDLQTREKRRELWTAAFVSIGLAVGLILEDGGITWFPILSLVVSFPLLLWIERRDGVEAAIKRYRERTTE